MPLPLTHLSVSVILALTLPMISMKLWAKMAPDDMAVEPPSGRRGYWKSERTRSSRLGGGQIDGRSNWRYGDEDNAEERSITFPL